MRASQSTWPYRPIHITNNGETCQLVYNKRRGLRKLTGVGIISNEHLQGIETVICANLRYPTTVIEFSPDGKAIRTDSPLLDTAKFPLGLCLACSVFRESTNERFCYRCDTEHAILFNGLKKLNLRVNLGNRIQESEYIQKYISKDPDIDINISKKKGRQFLQYDCPLLGYREVILPVFFEDRVIAVFFAGQIQVEWKQQFVFRKQKEFFKKHWCILEKYCESNPSYKPNRILKTILDLCNHGEKEKVDLLNKRQYMNLIGKFCSNIEDLEETLINQMSLQRNRYVRRRAEQRIRRFRDNLPSKEHTSDEKWDLLWKNTKNRLDELCSDFAIEYIVVFATKALAKDGALLLDVVVKTKNLPKELEEYIDKGQLTFNMGKLSENIHHKGTTSIKDQKLFDALEGFQRQLCREKNVIRVFPVSFFPKASMVILVGYYDWNLPITEENKWSNYSSSAPPNTFYAVVLSVLSSVLADSSESKLNNALLVLGHEADNINFGLDRIRKRYLDDLRRFRALSEERAIDVSRDIKGYIAQLNYLFKQAKMAIEEMSQPNKKLFWAYKTLLFKWRHIYRLKSFDKKISFEIYEPDRNDIRYPKVYADPILLELVIYNFVSNAIKYCYDGTNIEIECKREKPRVKNSPHILKVINYGREIKCDNLFEFGSRGSNVEGIEGVWIGMYNANRIANAHGTEINSECVKLSNFNIPIIEPYINNDFKGKDKSLIEVLKSELNILKKSGEYKKIITVSKWNLRLYNPEGYELVDFIREPTYKVTFKMKLSAKES